MSARISEALALWDNPVLQRFRRSRLRLRKSIFWYLLTLIVTTFVVSLTYILRTNVGTSGQDAARSLWIPLLIIQGLILMIKGTGSVSAGLIQDRIDGTLDYQRLTPVAPLRNLVGYLFGLPVLEYVMFALTLPHTVFIVIVGQIPPLTVLTVYATFLTCAVLYHMIGIASGMVMRRWIWGYLLSIFLVVFVNVVLPTAIAQLGLRVLQYLSMWPVIAQKVLPLIVTPGAMAQASQNLPFFSMADSVPFYVWSLSPLTFTLLLQGALIVTFAVMTLRRWASSTRHSLSKPYALAFLCGFIVLVIGNVWPIVTGRYMPFALFGQTSIDQLREVIPIALPLVYCLAVWLLCFVLFAIVVPSHDAYVRGIRRAIKLGRNAARPWDDDSGSVGFMSLFTAAALLGLWVVFHQIESAGFLAPFRDAGFGMWRLPAAFGLVLVYTTLLLQVLELRPTILAVLLLWFLPVLVATVLSAASQDAGSLHAVIASMSPIALVVMSGLMPIEAMTAGSEAGFFSSLAIGVTTGLVFVLVQIVALWARWRRLEAGYDRSCRSPSAAGPAAPDLVLEHV